MYVSRVFVCAVIWETARRNSDAALFLSLLNGCLLMSLVLLSLVVVLEHKTLLPSSCHLQTREQGEVERQFFC